MMAYIDSAYTAISHQSLAAAAVNIAQQISSGQNQNIENSSTVGKTGLERWGYSVQNEVSSATPEQAQSIKNLLIELINKLIEVLFGKTEETENSETAKTEEAARKYVVAELVWQAAGGGEIDALIDLKL